MTNYETLIMEWYFKQSDPYTLDKDIMSILDGLTEDQLEGLLPYEILFEPIDDYKEWLTILLCDFLEEKFPCHVLTE